MNPLGSAFTNIRRSPFQALTAIIIITQLLFIGYAFSLVAMGAREIFLYFETRPQVIGFFELNTPDTTIQEVNQLMMQKPYVKEVKLVTQDQALDIYRSDNQDDPLLLELITAEMLPASIEVSADDVASLVQVKNDLEAVQAVEEVAFQEDVADQLSNWTNTLRYLGIASMVILGITSFLIITALISMKVASRKRAIKIMRILGASRWYIEAPFFFEGVLYGLTGSLIGWAMMFGALQYLTPWLNDFLGSITLLPVKPEIFAIQLSIGTLSAMLLGGLAGIVAVRKIMR